MSASTQSSCRSRKHLTAQQRRACRVIVRIVSAHTGVEERSFFAPSRLCERTANARQLAMYLCHVLAGLTMTHVGQLFGRDRTTVAHACAQVEDLRDDAAVDIRIEALEHRFLSTISDPLAELRAIGERVHG